MQHSASVSTSPEVLHARWWPQGWWKIVDLRIGIIPIPIYAILIALLVGFVFTGDIKGEISVMIAVLVIGGFTCAEIGKRTLRNIGATPLAPKAPDRPDFHRGLGFARRFARKGREVADRLRRVGQRERRSAGRLRASSRGWEADLTPLSGGSADPP